MIDEMENEAKSKALEDLMQAMGDDDMKRKPLLTITISAGGKGGGPAAEMPEEEGMGEDFAERMRRERGF